MIITMAQTKGGSGKTTIAVNIAVEMARRGLNVGLLDCDPLETASRWAETRNKYYKDRKNASAGKIEHKWVQGDIRDSIVNMAERNDHVIIDPAGFDTVEMRFALTASDIALAPFRPKKFDLDVAEKVMETYSLASTYNEKLVLRAILNACPTNPLDKRAINAKQELREAGIITFMSGAYNREAWSDCTYDGLGVSETKNAKAIGEINNIVDELLEYQGFSPVNYTRNI